MNLGGNTNKVKSAVLVELMITQELSSKSVDKCFTRHFCNLYLYLNETELALVAWLPYMSNHLNVFEYSSKLLKQFKSATRLAVGIYEGKKRHNVDIDRVRDAFVSLIEKGLIIRLSDGKYIISPHLVYHKTYNGVDIQKRYLAAIRENKVVEMCELMIKKHRVR